RSGACAFIDNDFPLGISLARIKLALGKYPPTPLILTRTHSVSLSKTSTFSFAPAIISVSVRSIFFALSSLLVLTNARVPLINFLCAGLERARPVHFINFFRPGPLPRPKVGFFHVADFSLLNHCAHRFEHTNRKS